MGPTRPMRRPFDLRSCLEQLATLRGSCLRLEVGRIPTARVAGQDRQLDSVAPTPTDLNHLIVGLIGSGDPAKTGLDGDTSLLRKEPGIGRVHATVRRHNTDPSLEFRPAFGISRDPWGGISDSEYTAWRALTYVDTLAGEIDAELPPFNRMLGRAIALVSAIRRMNRPHLARAAEAIEARVRAHAAGRLAWDETKRVETTGALVEFRTLLDRNPADDADFANRVVEMRREDVEASRPVKPVAPRSPAWKIAEEVWRALVQNYGPPKEVSTLTAEERTRSIAEHRAMSVHTSRDGFGGGNVWFRLMENSDDDPPKSESTNYVIVFSAPCRISAAQVRDLNRNAWESWREIPLRL